MNSETTPDRVDPILEEHWLRWRTRQCMRTCRVRIKKPDNVGRVVRNFVQIPHDFRTSSMPRYPNETAFLGTIWYHA